MILFSDFDKTLFFQDDEQKTRNNIESIKKWRSENNQFCITTGRSYKSVTKKFPEIVEVSDYYIVDSGSIILSKNGGVLGIFYFDPAIVAEIVDFSKKISEVPVIYYFTPDSENADYKTENVTKLRLWFEDASLLANVAEQIERLFPVFAFKLDAGMPSDKALAGKKGFVEIIPIGLGKSNAIKFLQREKMIPFEDIVVVGDGFNDYEMIHDFDGFAIDNSELANAYKELKTISSLSSLVELFGGF